MSYKNPDILLFTNPIGIDAVVQSYQQSFYNGLPWLEKSLGRAYEQREGDKKVPKVYTGLKEYYTVLPNDFLKSASFLMARGPERSTPGSEEGVERDLSAVFWLNLKEIDADDDSIFTERLRWDVDKIIRAVGYTPEVAPITAYYDEKIEDIFFGYLDEDTAEKNKNYLMFPYAGFRIDWTAYFPRYTDCSAAIPAIAGASSQSDLEIAVGVGSGPAAGDTTWSDSRLVGKKIRFFRGGLKQGLLDIDGQPFYSFTGETGTITVNPAFQPDEVFSVEVYGFL